MAYWLAEKREGQDSDFIQRFDPRFWTLDFPRPMMGSAVTTAPDALRVDLEFHHRDALAGLIWASEDRYDHPLLAYETSRDYSRTTLSFRWRSGGIIALDGVHGPTLTIEGRDAAGNARTWYVRLWNFATGTPEDARIVLPFSDLPSGWEGTSGLVHPADIDRMFVSLVPQGHDPADSGLLAARVDGWVELSDIHCDGENAMLEIGDILLPPHDVQMATAFDDAYNQTPARLVRGIRGLGYRGRILHYLGMSHFFRLQRESGALIVDRTGSLTGPTRAWHEAYFAECARCGYELIASLSYELFAEHCPEEWQQRAHNGEPGRTGWEPPSALLSPANEDAMAYLRAVATRFTAMQEAAGLPVLFQVGEPWWWTIPASGKPCLYDDAMAALFPDPPVITDMRAPMDQAQRDYLEFAGSVLADSTAALGQAVRDAASGTAEILLLAFTPTILDPATPEAYRANLPIGWAWPAFDRLQLEDYDWLTAGRQSDRRRGYAFVQARLAYPLADQDYLSGFVLLPQDADVYWQRIDGGLEEARARGIEQLFVWAQPQVNRDGYTRLPPAKDDDMQSFDDVLFPLALGRNAGVSPEFSTSVAVTASGHERRASRWSDARTQYDVGPGVRSEAELGVLIEFFRARRGAARAFRLEDPFDHSSNAMTGMPTPGDQVLGYGDGDNAEFALVKRYGIGPEPQVRRITHPRAGTVMVAVDGVATSDFTLLDNGRIMLGSVPGQGAEITAGFLFDVRVRFAEDRLDVSSVNFAAGEVPSVPLIEVRSDA